MPNLPDVPGKDLVEGTTKRARALAVGAAGAVLTIGGFVVKRVLSHGDGEKRPEAGSATAPTDPGPTPSDAGPPPTAGGPTVVPTGEGRRTATKPKPAAKPQAAKPKRNAAKSKAAKPPKPKVGKSKPAKLPKPKAAEKPKVDLDKPPATTGTDEPPATTDLDEPPATTGTGERPTTAGTSEPPATTGTDAPTVPGAEPGDQRGGKDPHHALNNPVTDPDETEYPDPYDKREDPRDPVDPDDAPFGAEPHPPTGAESTSEPPPTQDPEVGDRARPPRRENLDD